MTAYRPDKPEIIEIPVPLVGNKPPLTANDRLHHMVKARRTKLVRQQVGWQARSRGIGPQDYIIVQLHYEPTVQRDRDPSNLMPTQKPALDGLRDAGVIPNDTPEYVGELMPVIHEPGKGVIPRLWLAVSVGVARPLSEQDRQAIAEDVHAERTGDARDWYEEGAEGR